MFLNSNSFLNFGAACTRGFPRKLHNFIGLRLAKIKASGKFKREVHPGVFLELDLSDWLQRLYYVGLVEQSIFNQLKTLVPVGGTFVDVGAYIGLFTCVMANHVGPTGSVIAFEPMHECFEQLQRNITLNKFQNVQTQPFAVSNETGSMDLYLPEYFGGTSGVAQVWNPGNWKVFSHVSSVTLDSVFYCDALHLIKIDVEGHELEVLTGARQIIEHHHPIILCEVTGPNQKAVFELLQSLDYEVSQIKGRDQDFYFMPHSYANR